MPKAGPVSQCGTLMVGERFRHVDRTDDHRVVVLARAIRRVWVRDVGDAQQQLTQFFRDAIMLGGECPLGLAELAALRHRLFGAFDVARLAQLTDGLAQLVDLSPGVVALTRDLAQPLVVAGGVVDLDEDLRVVSAGKGRADTFQIGAQQPYVNHGSSG